MEVATESSEIERLRHEVGQLRRELDLFRTWVPPGHYYSPIPAPDEIEAKPGLLAQVPDIPGVELNLAKQLELLRAFAKFRDEVQFPKEPTESHRYYSENDFYPLQDAVLLSCLLRHVRPKRVVEIGSGFSSAMILDTNEHFFGNSLDCCFIDPEPNRLNALLKEGDSERITLVPRPVQDVETASFAALQANDILFVDSTHVAKFGSDVNHFIFNILPMLAPGVYVHFHDIFHPFEYPLIWLREGRAWNEAYLLKAFLQFNREFEVVLFQSYLYGCHRKALVDSLPIFEHLSSGGSLWIRRKQ